jgi:tetratricopeptide (TPR) repeat protein
VDRHQQRVQVRVVERHWCETITRRPQPIAVSRVWSRVPHAIRSLLVVLGAATLGCAPFVAVTTEPGRCGSEDVSLVIGASLHGHAPLLADDYPDELCDWNDTTLSAGQRRRMTRTTSHFQVGRAWAKVGEHERAIAAFRRDLAGATTQAARVATLVQIAELLSKAGEHEAALRELDAADEERGERSRLLVDTRANVLVAAGRRREAIAVFEARPATDRWVANALAQIRIGELWLEEGEPARARAAFEAAVAYCEGQRVDDEIFDARFGLVRALWSEGRPQQALAELDRLLESADQQRVWLRDAEAWRLRADFELALDNPWGAAASVRRAFELEHPNVEPSELAKAGHRAELASLHLRAGRPELAVAGFEAAYRTFDRELGPLHRRTLTAAHNVGVASLQLGDAEQATRWLRLAASGKTAVAAEPYELGITLLQLGHAELRAGLQAEAAATFAAALDQLGELDDPRLSDSMRASTYRDAARAFLDAEMCERAVATVELAKDYRVRLGEDPSYVDITGTQVRLEQLRRCWGPNRPGFD